MTARPRKELTTQQKRMGLMIVCGLLLLMSGPCIVAPFGEFKGHRVGPSQSQAYDRFRKGERLSESEVAALAGDEWQVSPAEEQGATWKFFWARVVFLLSAVLIAIYLYRTREQSGGIQNGQPHS